MPLLTLLTALANQDSAQRRGVRMQGPPTSTLYMNILNAFTAPHFFFIPLPPFAFKLCFENK